MNIIIVAKNKATGQKQEFSEADWHLVSQTGVFQYVTTKAAPQAAPVQETVQARGLNTNTTTKKEPLVVKKKSGCNCGKR